MKLVVTFILMSILICSCHQVIPGKEESNLTEAKRDEIQKMYDDYELKLLQQQSLNAIMIDGNKMSEDEWKTFVEEHPNTEVLVILNEKEQYRFDSIAFEKKHSNARIMFSIDPVNPNIRGPLTNKQVKEELDSLLGYDKDEWEEISNQYRKSDEFYYYRDERVRGFTAGVVEMYLLIRENKCIGFFTISSLLL